MIPLFTGVLAFLPFLWYDVLTVKRRPYRFAVLCGGSIILTASTLFLLWETGATQRFMNCPLQTALPLIPALFSLAGLVYVLFFALPFSDTYAGSEQSQTVSSGLYGICRHPGVWFLSGVYFFLALAVPHGLMWAAFVLFSLCDVFYVLWQERYIFPITLAGYDKYQKEVPFLIPTRASLRRGFQKNKK